MMKAGTVQSPVKQFAHEKIHKLKQETVSTLMEMSKGEDRRTFCNLTLKCHFQLQGNTN